MSLCYLYSQTSSYQHKNKILDSFKDSVSFDVNQIDVLNDYDVYIIDLDKADKNISIKLNNIFKQKQHALIYFVIPKDYSLLLFQLCFLLETKAIITQNQDIDKAIAKIESDKKSFIQNNLEKWLGAIKINTQEFFVFRNNKLLFVNQKILDNFGCKDQDHFSIEILAKIDVDQLLASDIALSVKILSSLDVLQNYTFKSLSVSKNEKIIYLQNSNVFLDKPNFMSSRVSFIETLKEKILQKDDLDFQLSLLAINIENTKALVTEFGIVEFENILLKLLSFMESTLEEKILFSQFENDFYVVLFENTSFEDTNTLAQHFLTTVLHHISTNQAKIALDLFTYDLHNLEFSEILTTLNTIENENFSLNETNSQYIKHLTSKSTKINAKHLLDDAYTNKLKFKILNIYHGLVINTSSRIIKITEDNIYISFEPLQGIVLENEKTTVLQSESFSQDIFAEVIQINLSKRVAILANFKFLKTNANARQHARVSTPVKVAIAINIAGSVFHGVILDISIKSIAIKMKHIAKIGTPELQPAVLTFNLTDKTSENGYVQLNLESQLIVCTPVDKDGYYKVVCDLEQNSHDLDVVLKYVYERQKELIVELKKMSKLN